MTWTTLLAATVSLAALTAPLAAEQLRIGAVLPLSGASATSGEDQRRGIELAIAEVNAAGGVLGEPVVAVVEDSGARVPSALDAAKKLVTVDNVPVVIGEYSSGITIPMATYLMQEHRVHLNIGSSSSDVRKIGASSFSVIGLDDISSAFAAQDLYDQGFRKIAVITPNNAYGQGTATAFEKAFTALGGAVVDTLLYTEGQTSYRRELQQLQRTQPDAFFYSAYGKEAATLNREAFELGLSKTPWYAGYLSMCTADSDPAVIEGQMGYDLNYVGANGQAYSDAYQARYGEPFVTSFSGYAYDAAKLVMQAAEQAGTTDPAALSAKIAEIGAAGYEGATGLISLDADGQRTEQPYLKQSVQDGKPVSR